MRVVVFGATGLCGEEIADVFETRHEVIRFKGHRDGDISNLFEIQKKLEPMKPDLIINATGYRHPKNLALLAEKMGCDFMQISSDSVFSGDTKWPYSEFDIPDPNNIYGQTKYLAERAIAAVCRHHYIIRVPMLFGFKGKPEENLMFQTWENMKNHVRMDAATDQICNPTYTKDAAECMMKVAESGMYGTYHISNEGLGSRYDLLCEFARIAGLKYDKWSTYTAFNAIAFKCTFGVELEEWHTAIRRMYRDYEEYKKNGH